MKVNCKIILATNLYFIFAAITFASSWDNSFRVINNYNQDLVISIFDNNTNVNLKNCPQSSISNYSLQKQSISCSFELTTKQEGLTRVNKGKIKVSLATDPASYCLMDYSYDYNYSQTKSQFQKYSQNFSNSECHGLLNTNMLSVDNPRLEASVRPVAGPLVDSYKLDATILFSQATCGGSKNCLIIAPDANTIYQHGGSSLARALNLQASIDEAESLNIAQFIGGHNSLISPFYTTSHSLLNLSYADPDNYQKVTDMLNTGVRMLEIDVGKVGNSLGICHNHSSEQLTNTLCENNTNLSSTISEIKAWIVNNPDQLLLLYIDPNSGLEDNILLLDNELSMLEPYIFTPQMAGGKSLNLAKFSKASLIDKYKSNIIIVTTGDKEKFSSSSYLFTAITNSTKAPLYFKGVGELMQSSKSGIDKYQVISDMYSSDAEHINILRLTSTNTILDYVDAAMNDKRYNDFFTTENIRISLTYPINLYALSMTGFSCSDSSCTKKSTDPRYYSLLWSWSLGYPLVNGSNYAYINSNSGHFENDSLVTANYALCQKAYNPRNLEKEWLIVKLSSAGNVQEAQDKCRENQASFSAPSTSYYMDDVLRLTHQTNIVGNILVNYHKVDKTWKAN